MVHSFDPRNASLEPEYYGDVDGQKYAERKPLIWFWMMFDRSPVGLTTGLGSACGPWWPNMSLSTSAKM